MVNLLITKENALPVQRDEYVWYEERNQVGYLTYHFADEISTKQCERLRQAFNEARRQDTKVIVLRGETRNPKASRGQAASSSHSLVESWQNTNALHCLIHDILATESHVVISASSGSPSSKGTWLALTGDYTIAQEGSTLTPYVERTVGSTSGYGRYLLTKRAGAAKAAHLLQERLPLDCKAAKQAGLIDDIFAAESFTCDIIHFAERLAISHYYIFFLMQKRHVNCLYQMFKPLEEYRG